MLQDLRTANSKGKNVLLRIDTDVPIENGKVTDDERLKASIPTIKHLLADSAKVTIIGHIGRPKGEVVESLRMRPVEERLEELLGTHNSWQILENLRFDPREEANDPSFVQELTKDQEVFVQDAFAACHRSHASTFGVAQILPSYAGLSVQKEVDNLTTLLQAEDMTIIIGGKKAEDKLPVISSLFQKTENVLTGGVVANTFLVKKGFNLGRSLVEEEVFQEAEDIVAQFDKSEKTIFLPQDLVLSRSVEKQIGMKVLSIDDMNEEIKDYFAVDIGPQTIQKYKKMIVQAKVIFFNGNMGVSEVGEFSTGTMEIARAIIESQAKKYAGGGDTAKFLRDNNMADKFDYISNGGGATLDFLAGKNLPGLYPKS